MNLPTEPYPDQAKLWPDSGRHILAHADADSLVVYQAFRQSIGAFVLEHGRFGGPEYSFGRMSWIKPSFLWMIYRSGWGTKPDQERTLGLRLRRVFFDSLLAQTVASTWDKQGYNTREDWQEALTRSAVRVQWDPDHNPHGGRLERRAIQLGLRGDALEAFGQRELLEVIDLTKFVAEQRSALVANGVWALWTPRERVYSPGDPALNLRLGLTPID